MVRIEDYGEFETAWCPGCGNFGILKALKKALVGLGKEPHEVLLVSGIGQSGKLPHYLRCNTFNGLHGRTLPPATGAKAANQELTVLAIAGDGDAYGEGGNHLVHAIRRNPDITLLVHNNQIYGLTKGQASPTSDLGMKTKVQGHGVFETPLNPLALAISLDCSFVARGFAGDVSHLSNLIAKAIKHKGFSLVDILQPCVTFNRLNTFQWYRERVYRLEDTGHRPDDRTEAFEKSLEWGDKIPIGVFYERRGPTFEDNLPALSRGPLYRQKHDLSLVEKLMEKFM
ncbi:MAG: 2-oxoacid:ferredoxin oxidoreductase subunit beta [Methanobacteriota archaeon]|nr:MAG: 2-oxoacid:ferredoxin oxidoreductase subunit beta [Euryarchaeota archaeon]